MSVPMPMSTRPPRISARLPMVLPRKLPKRRPMAAMMVVARPMARAVSRMLTSRKARPTPTIMESMLVAKAMATSMSGDSLDRKSVV